MFAWLNRSVCSMVTCVAQPQDARNNSSIAHIAFDSVVGKIEVGIHAFDEPVKYEGARLPARKEVDENASPLAHRKRLLASGRARATVRLAASCPRPEPIAVMPETHKPR